MDSYTQQWPGSIDVTSIRGVAVKSLDPCGF